MLAKVISATVVGLEAVQITVEVDVAARGFPTFKIVGMPDKSIEESKDRIRTALANASFPMPESKIVVNLSPADIQKEGSAFDLPIAIGLLAAQGFVKYDVFAQSLFVGELSLDGKLQQISGVLPIVSHAKKLGLKAVFLPEQNVHEASLIKDILLFPLQKLTDLILHLNEHVQLKAYVSQTFVSPQTVISSSDYADVKGQIVAKRALEIAAAGGHNVMFKGPPGAGKTMLARCFPSILPSMDEDEIIEVTKIYSVAQALSDSSVLTQRPFRAPHHTISRIGLIGGGRYLSPGEITLAHRGVLFLDEFPEYPRSVIEALRQPLEDGKITISRASGVIDFPARFILIAAANPCPCGFLGHPQKPCNCTMTQILNYKKRVSGPILERIDMHVDVFPVKKDELLSEELQGERSEAIRSRVEIARKIQKERFHANQIKTNAEMQTRHIKKYCSMEDKTKILLRSAFSRLSLSARTYYKIIKISQTIADLEKSKTIKSHHISEAIQYRIKEE